MDEKGIDDLVIWYYGKDQNVYWLYMIEEFPTDVNFRGLSENKSCPILGVFDSGPLIGLKLLVHA